MIRKSIFLGFLGVLMSVSLNAQIQKCISGENKVFVKANTTILNIEPNVLEDFESYADFTTAMPPWILHDIDATVTYGITDVTFPNSGTAMAYIVFNPNNTTPSLGADTELAANSGEKFAACFNSIPAQGSTNNDWLISPQMALGTNSNLSFYGKSYTTEWGPEKLKVLVSTTGTDPSQFTEISPGTLELPGDWTNYNYSLSQYDGMDIHIAFQCLSEDAFILMLDDILVSTEESSGGSTLAGMVTDAVDGTPISGALVTVAGLTDFTDSEGNYSIANVPQGSLTANFMGTPTSGESPLTVQFTDLSTSSTQLVTCSATGYITYNNSQVIIEDGGTVNLNISLSPTITGDGMRFVLNWGENPRDLDSHLRTPEIEGAAHHVYYSNKGSATSAPYATLDHDDTQSFGPETITIYDFFTGVYHYYVHKFAGSGEITTSSAVVQIYDNTGLLHTIQAPVSGTGIYWYVCTVNGANQSFDIINVIQDTEPGTGKSNVVYPAKPDTENKDIEIITTWNWSFGDGQTSTLQNPNHIYESGGTYSVSLTVGDGSAQNSLTKEDYIVVEGGQGNATLQGMVTDAVDGTPIEGALVSVAGLTDLTDASGNYLIENVPQGSLTSNFMGTPTSGDSPLTVQFTDLSTSSTQLVTCSATDYITYNNSQVIIEDGGTVNLNISLSPTITGDGMRFVLNWGENPRDLDSHLRTPDIEGSTHHVYYSNKGSATSAPYVTLDHDDTQSYGPETVTIYDFFTGVYHYYVHKFAGSGEITTSAAVVQIYDNTGLLHTIQAPVSGTGIYWYVCTVNGANQSFDIINVIQDTEPGTGKSNVVYPAKPDTGIKEVDIITSWSWNFGDGQTSTQQNPSHVYQNGGTYSVSLIVSDGASQHSLIRENYIVVVGSQGTATLTGMVSNAVDGTPIEGALVTVAGLTDLTDADGNYVIENVPEGSLTANFMATPTHGTNPLTVQYTDLSTTITQLVTCSATGFSTYNNNQVAIAEGSTVNLNISLSPTISGDEMRFVLNWGQDPRDLDSHLRTPEIEGTSYHVYYSSQGSAEVAPYATLDHDDTQSYGPETTTIYQFFNGVYHYYIYKFAGSGELITSSAVVQIYNESGLINTLQVPVNGEGDYWYVGTIDGATQTMNIINTIQTTEPGTGKSNVVYPPKPQIINHMVNSITSWAWSFGDGQSSTVANPNHIYTADGLYTVSLEVSDGSNSHTEYKVGYIYVGNSFSIDELEEEMISLYPNPAIDFVKFESELEIHQIKIFDRSGRLLFDSPSSDKSVSIDINHFKSGVYMVQIHLEEKVITKKLIIR